MENLIKGWVFSALGFVVFVATLLHYFGFLTFPKPTALDNDYACVISLIVSAACFSFPKTKIDDAISQAFVSVWGKFFPKKEA